MSSSFLKPSVTPRDGVGHQAARQAVELAELADRRAASSPELVAVDLEADAGRQRLPQLALRALDLDGAGWTSILTPFGIGDGFLANSRHVVPVQLQLQSSSWTSWSRELYHTLQSTSPPTPALTASRPVMTPRDVVRMLVPRPASTSGTSSRPK